MYAERTRPTSFRVLNILLLIRRPWEAFRARHAETDAHVSYLAQVLLLLKIDESHIHRRKHPYPGKQHALFKLATILQSVMIGRGFARARGGHEGDQHWNWRRDASHGFDP